MGLRFLIVNYKRLKFYFYNDVWTSSYIKKKCSNFGNLWNFKIDLKKLGETTKMISVVAIH